jgi:hypothetical protein
MPSIRFTLQVSCSPFSGSFGNVAVGFGQEAIGFFLRIAERRKQAGEMGFSVGSSLLKKLFFPSDDGLFCLVGKSMEYLLTTATLLTNAILKSSGLASLETVNCNGLLKFQPFSMLQILEQRRSAQ